MAFFFVLFFWLDNELFLKKSLICIYLLSLLFLSSQPCLELSADLGNQPFGNLQCICVIGSSKLCPY